MKLIGVKVLINSHQRFKEFVYADTDDNLEGLLRKVGNGQFAMLEHTDVVFYFGFSDNYDPSKMHISPKECRLVELISGNDSRPFILIKINQMPVPASVFPNAFNRLRSAQTTLILPTKNKYKNAGMNALWNWLIEEYLDPTEARFKKDQGDEMNDFMRQMHEMLW